MASSGADQVGLLAMGEDAAGDVSALAAEEGEPKGGPPRSGRLKAVAAAAALVVGLTGLAAAAASGRGAPLAAGVASDGVAQLRSSRRAGSGGSVVYGSDADNSCPSGYARITDLGECRAALPLLEGGDPDGFNGQETDSNYPSGCYSCADDTESCESGVWFNKDLKGAEYKGARPVCKKGFAIKPGATVFVGDSDIDYWHSSSKAIPGSYNLGIGGQTCKDVQKEIDFILKRFQPGRVVLVCGENDLAGSADVKTTFKRWSAVVSKISAAGVPIVQLGTKPESYTKELHSKYQQFDAKIKAYVTSVSRNDGPPPITFVDTFKAFKERGNKDSLYDPNEAPNYLHLGPKGYALWDKWVQLGLGRALGCMIWNGGKCETQAPTVVVIKESTDECPTGYAELTTEAECKAAIGLVKLKTNSYNGAESNSGWPAGCYYCHGADGCGDGTWFNSASSGKRQPGARLYCKVKV